MLKKKYIRGTLKVLSFAVCFAAIFLLLQPVFVPKNESSVIVNQFYDLAEEDLDVLFLGASQMFCSVNAQKLTEEYGISAFDFGTSGQVLPTTCWYLREALQETNPDVVMVELCEFFDPICENGLSEEQEGQQSSWSFNPMRLSMQKLRFLYDFFDGDLAKTAEYGFPLLKYHTRWNAIQKTDFHTTSIWDMTINRGFLVRDGVEPVTIAYTGGPDGEEREIPKHTEEAIAEIAETCHRGGVQLIFFKTPVSDWTRTDARIVKAYMAEHGYTYLELNDHLDEIGIDSETDFYNKLHLNTFGANKTTDFLAGYLADTFGIGNRQGR